jgi:hypothetical protein
MLLSTLIAATPGLALAADATFPPPIQKVAKPVFQDDIDPVNPGQPAGQAAADNIIRKVEIICEPTSNAVNTVNVKLWNMIVLDYTFKKLPNGPTTAFAASGLPTSRKFALPAGVYQLSYKQPTYPAVGIYNKNITVPPYQVINGSCKFLKDLPSTATSPVN